MPDQSSAATEHAIIQEITAPLETLPDDPLSVIEADFPHALRGYDRLAVDDYVERTRRLVAELAATRSPEAAVRRALQRVGDQITGILQRAHETAESITAQSRSEAEDRLQQARTEAEQIAGTAEHRVKELDADTDRIWMERQRIVADAEDLAAQLLALAKVAAERFPNDEDASASESKLTPYDDAALVAGMPVEAGAPEFEAEPDAEIGAAGDPEAEIEEEFELEEDDDVTRTVAFTPLQESGEETAAQEVTETTGEPRESEPGARRVRRSGSTDDDSKGVIRPASQAANRRLGR